MVSEAFRHLSPSGVRGSVRNEPGGAVVSEVNLFFPSALRGTSGVVLEYKRLACVFDATCV